MLFLLCSFSRFACLFSTAHQIAYGQFVSKTKFKILHLLREVTLCRWYNPNNNLRISIQIIIISLNKNLSHTALKCKIQTFSL